MTGLKIAVLIPIPSPKVAITTSVKPGLLRSVLNANRMSCINGKMGLAPVTEQGYWDGSVAVKGWAVTTVGTGRAPLRARC